MKTVTQDYTNQEEANQRKPVELYHIWRDGGVHWRYTSGDVPVTFGGEVYSVSPLSRGSVTYNSKLDITNLQINAPALFSSTIEYISQNPIEILWISVSKLHRDQDPLEADIIFIGQIKEVSYKGIEGIINCVGFEHFLKGTIPHERYQFNCNHKVFDSKCALVKASYITSTIIGIDATGTILTSSDFDLKADGYFIGGEVIHGVESRTITYHIGNTIKLMYKMNDLEAGDLVSAYPGCDGRAATCRDKFNNIIHFFGFPFIPIENPATRIP